MARVVALVPDLLFGSRVQGALSAAGHEVQLVGDRGQLEARLSDAAGARAAVLVIDLADGELDGVGVVESLKASGALGSTRTLGFYSHVDARTRERAERADFDLVVPRSRMAREGAALVVRLAEGAPPASG
jgi:DNA-binding NarL/FixJ family response regulator